MRNAGRQAQLGLLGRSLVAGNKALKLSLLVATKGLVRKQNTNIIETLPIKVWILTSLIDNKIYCLVKRHNCRSNLPKVVTWQYLSIPQPLYCESCSKKPQPRVGTESIVLTCDTTQLEVFNWLPNRNVEHFETHTRWRPGRTLIYLIQQRIWHTDPWHEPA